MSISNETHFFEAKLCSELFILKEKSKIRYTDHPGLATSMHLGPVQFGPGSHLSAFAASRDSDCCDSDTQKIPEHMAPGHELSMSVDLYKKT